MSVTTAAGFVTANAYSRSAALHQRLPSTGTALIAQLAHNVSGQAGEL